LAVVASAPPNIAANMTRSAMRGRRQKGAQAGALRRVVMAVSAEPVLFDMHIPKRSRALFPGARFSSPDF
jgi:hypothetical protein